MKPIQSGALLGCVLSVATWQMAPNLSAHHVGETTHAATIQNLEFGLHPGIVFGPGVAAADRELIRAAHSINEKFWGPLPTTILAYQTIPEVIAAYEAMCRCSVHPQHRLELAHEAMTTAPNAMLISLETFGPFSQKMERLTHEEVHAVQRGYTDGRTEPTWMAEGHAEYSQVHAMADAGLVNVAQYHHWIRPTAIAYGTGLRDWEQWPRNPLEPGGCMETNSCHAPYILGHFASDLLTFRFDRSTMVTFWEETGNNLRRGDDPHTSWRRAFESVFRLPIDQFYSEFERYRLRGLVGPTLREHPLSQTIGFGKAPSALAVAATGSGGGLTYQWYRGHSGRTSVAITGATLPTYSPPTLTSTSRYWVRVMEDSIASDSETATVTVAFTDSSLPNVPIKAAHIAELRTRIDALRARYGLAGYSYEDAVLVTGATFIRAQHVNDLRQALNAVYIQASLLVPVYSGSAISPGMLVNANHIAEIRAAVAVLE